MSLWSDGTGGDESKPSYILPANIGKHYDLNRCYATASGWEITHESGQNELLVAIGGLSTRLGAATVTGVEWGGNFYGGGTATVTVCYNEALVITGHPTIYVTKSTGGSITATHTSNSKNRVVFSFTVTDGLATILSLEDQDIDLNGGSITDVDGETSAVAISAEVAAAIYPTATKTIAVESIASVALSAGTYYGTETSHTMTVTFTSPVTVGAGTARTIATVWNAGVGPVATYSAGSGTNALVFTLAGIPDEAGTLSIATQTLGGNATLTDTLGSAVSAVISSGVATITGTKVVLPDAPVSVVWDATAPFVKNTAEYLVVNYGAAVTVAGGTPTVLVAWSGVSGPTVVASYASGTGTSALRFNFTVPNEAGTASFNAQTILGTGTMKGAHADTVNHIIAAPAVASTETKIVAA